MDRAQLRYLLNSGPSRVFDVRKLRFEEQLEPIFKIGKLNGTILLKQSRPDQLDDADDLPPILTMVFLPYDRKKPEDGGKSFIYSPSRLRSVIGDFIGERFVKQEELTADTELLSIFDRIPSFSPFLIRDALERANITIPDGYLTIPAREAAMIKQRMRARLRPLVAIAFSGNKTSVSETSIERLVQTLWELKDLTELQPLISAFRIPPDQAPEIFYCWVGIAFFENEYIKLQLRLKRLATWMGSKTSPREALPRELLAHYQHAVDGVRKHLQANWKGSLNILKEYMSTYQELIDSSGTAARFIAFLRNSKSHFWSLGGQLGRLEQSVEMWDLVASRFGYGVLPFERAEELMNVLTLVNSNVASIDLGPAPAVDRKAAI